MSSPPDRSMHGSKYRPRQCPGMPGPVGAYAIHLGTEMTVQLGECSVLWGKHEELYGGLAFHSTTFSHLQALISLAPILPTFNICLWNWRREVPGEEARLPNVCLCSLTNVAWYVLISHLLVA